MVWAALLLLITMTVLPVRMIHWPAMIIRPQAIFFNLHPQKPHQPSHQRNQHLVSLRLQGRRLRPSPHLLRALLSNHHYQELHQQNLNLSHFKQRQGVVLLNDKALQTQKQGYPSSRLSHLLKVMLQNLLKLN